VNVLITSASRKVWLVRALQEALDGRGRVIAADLTRWAPAMHVADAGVLLPRSEDPTFLDALEEVCVREEVVLAVPTRDGELPILAAARERFAAAGVHLAVSAPNAIETCLDKMAFTRFCVAHGFPVPRPVEDPTSADLPLFARPRRGQASAGAGIVRTADALAACTNHVFAEVVDAPEYTVDVFLDRDGRPISSVPRERTLVVAGESQVTTTVDDPELADHAASLCAAIGLSGPATVQAFRTTDQLLFIEVNPRFGGACALSIRAGADSPRWLLDEADGATLTPRLGEHRVGLTMLRYGADIFVAREALDR
jgi:carbamoyl-phosphate synthase large subunit